MLNNLNLRDIRASIDEIKFLVSGVNGGSFLKIAEYQSRSDLLGSSMSLIKSESDYWKLSLRFTFCVFSVMCMLVTTR